MQLIILTGLSGSGKSVALKALEDSAYYTCDNLPAPLLPALVDFLEGAGYQRVAVSVDVLVPVAVSSDGTSCWQCSRAVLLAGISRVWLLQAAPGYYPFDIAAAVLRSYTAAEFHRLTLEACELPVIMQETP